MPTRHTIFMSHAHADNTLCQQYALALHDRFGFDVWLDIENGQVAGGLPGNIMTQLVQRSALVLMLTRASNVSLWVGHELDNFIAYAYDPNMRMVNGLERVVLPVFLEASLPPIVDGRATNSAKVRGGFWVDAAHMSFDQAVAAIAHALGAPGGAVQVPAPLPARAIPHTPPAGWPLPGTPTATHAGLASLGFAGRSVNGIEVIIPPVCEVPAGDFIMGSDVTHDPQAQANEMPQYLAPLEHAYEIGMYPVTVAEYACAVRAKAVREPQKAGNVDWAAQQQRPDHPVVCVSWNDALAYVRWLAQVTGQPWRLPTEAEWEKAARGTDGRIYPWGNQWDETRANTNDGGPKTTTPIGAYAERGDASPYGVHDQAGNVWEWCSSLYQSYPYNANDGRENLDSTGNRVLRGGSWLSYPRLARAACRSNFQPDLWSVSYGFRLACAAAGSS
jgi:formylglycine-generating enzyme required for sulfatase activity